MDIRQVDQSLYLIQKNLLFSTLQPINLDQEKANVLRDRYYNPRFKYKIQRDLNHYELKLQKLKTDLSPLGVLFNQKKQELQKKIFLLQSIGTPSLTLASLGLYGKPSQELVTKAKKILDTLPTERNGVKSSNISNIKNFLEAIINYGFNWDVRQKDMLVGASFNITKRIVYINKNRTFTDNDIKRLIIHELGTHIMRAENAKKQRLNLFLIGFPGYLETEEGLATYNEQRAGLLNNEILRNYAGRVIAIHLALKNPFSTTYNYLLEFFPKETAFNLTLRAKRGIADTSKPGALTKDYIYLSGKYKVENFVKQGGNVKDLYLGKIGVEHIEIAKKLC